MALSFDAEIVSFHLQNRTAVRSALLGPLHVGYDYLAEEFSFRATQRMLTGRLATVAHSAGVMLYTLPLLHVSSADRSNLRAWHAAQDDVQLVFNLALQASCTQAVMRHNVAWSDPLAPLPVPYMPNHSRWDGNLLLRGARPGFPSVDVLGSFTLDSPDFGVLNSNRLG